MTAFDLCVCEWLNTASIPVEKKQALLNRMSIGIGNYRMLEIDPHQAASSGFATTISPSAVTTVYSGRGTARSAAAGGFTVSSTKRTAAGDEGAGTARSAATVDTNLQNPVNAPPPTTIDVDYSLQHRISKALKRLQEGDEGTAVSPLFTNPEPTGKGPSGNIASGGGGGYAASSSTAGSTARKGSRSVEGSQPSAAAAAAGGRDSSKRGSVAGTSKPVSRTGSNAPLNASVSTTGSKESSVTRGNNNETSRGSDYSTPLSKKKPTTSAAGGKGVVKRPVLSSAASTAKAAHTKAAHKKAADLDGPPASPKVNPAAKNAFVPEFCFGSEESPADRKPLTFLGDDKDEEEPHDGPREGSLGGSPGEGESISPEEDFHRRSMMGKRKSRNAISAEIIDAESAKKFTAPAVPKSPEHRRILLQALETHHLFSFLDDEDLKFVVDMMRCETYPAANSVIVERLDNDSRFYVVVAGGAKITECTTTEEYNEALRLGGGSKQGGDGLAQSKLQVEGSVLPTGSCFGEIALMYDAPCPVTVITTAPSTVVCSIDRFSYKNICTRSSMNKRAQYEGFLSKVRFLQALTREERLKLADALKSAKYKRGDRIISFGEPGKWFNIIIEGTIDVIGRDRNGKEVKVCSFGPGDCVGELEFLYKHNAVADCVAASDVVKTAKMTAGHFEKVIGPAKDILERNATSSEVYSYYRQTEKK